jgi:serine protease Do
MFRKIFKKVIVIFVIMMLGGLGGIIASRYFFPYLTSTRLFSKYEFLKKSFEEVTIINKTEQVFVKEETSIEKIANQASASVVNIVSIPQKNYGANKNIFKNGTGLIVTSDGMIITYAEAIIFGDAKYKVLTFDGASYEAEFLGLDSYSNLAFLKISASNLPVAAFGNSDDTISGEKIITIGNNYGSYDNLYGAGLLRSFNPVFNLAGKTVSSSEKLEGTFETDFNSGSNFVGGPIVDYAGRVIGITGSLEIDGGHYYFQIPANKVKKVIDRAIRKELEKNPYLGIYYVPLSTTFILANDLNVNRGAMIYSSSGQQGLAVIAGSPAQKAGLMVGDVIMAINNQEINSKNTLSDVLYQYKKGDEIELAILRNKQEIKIKIRL